MSIFGLRLRQVAAGIVRAAAARGPSGIDQHVFEARRRGEIDVMVHGRGVHAGAEIHALGIAAGPPVPGSLAGLDPRRVGDRGRRIQVGDDGRFDQASGLCADHDDAPRRPHRSSGRNGDSGLFGGRRELAKHRPRIRSVVQQVHARVVLDVRLGDRDPGHARQFHQHRHGHQLVGVQRAQRQRCGSYLRSRCGSSPGPGGRWWPPGRTEIRSARSPGEAPGSAADRGRYTGTRRHRHTRALRR